MAKRMLIDATHHEETRVVVMDGNKLTEFDYESQFRRQLKGNIFLAKVTRVEPSLQAAFVNFGGNRHGFLPFAEIHPDYYRIPVADREALLAEQQAMEEAARAAEDAEDAEDDNGDRLDHQDPHDADKSENNNFEDDTQGADAADLIADETGYVHEDVSLDPARDTDAQQAEQDSDFEPAEFEGDDLPEASFDSEQLDDAELSDPAAFDEHGDRGSDEALANSEDDQNGDVNNDAAGQGRGRDQNGRRGWRRGNGGRYGRGGGGQNGGHRGGRYMGARNKRDEISDEGPIGLHARFRRKYKIQEVIKRGQIMLIQVSKEERGNKGAAVTTYLSLPGRYCVLMPNSPRGGGVSRKIDNFADRRRLKSMLRALEIPSGMSVILRTAGVERSETDIKRDYDYLLRLWNNIRELTLQSTAPASIYEEGDLIKRSIRDIYTDDIEEITVSGERGFKEARDFMGLMMPSHMDQVVEYKNDKIPLFQRYQVEGQINCIGEPVVQLKSGGYLVINQTEALVAVDVNSGRSTRERHIEETALKTNLEAAEEVARQLRLRDLGGLVVIDFIDMEDRRNNMKVERRLKDALSTDRARIQVSRISNFGLLELSRQRLNPSLTEAQFQKCPHCHGFGYIRSVDSAAIMALRSLEEEGVRARATRVALHIPNAIALYILNSKRDMLATIEQRYAFKVMINVDESLAPSDFRVEALRNEVADIDEGDSDVSVDEPSADQASAGRRSPRNKKPVLMEQALELVSDGDSESDMPGHSNIMDDSESAGENFNRPDVEPDSELNRIPDPSRGPRRRNGRAPNGRERNRNRGSRHGQPMNTSSDLHADGTSESLSGDRQDRKFPSGQDQNQGQDQGQGSARHDRGEGRQNNRGPRRNNNRGRGGGRDGNHQSQGARSPRDDRSANDMPITPRSFDHAGEVPVSSTMPVDSSSSPKTEATYFVAKRRSTNTNNESGDTSSSVGQPSSTISSDTQSHDPSGGPKKKGWWSKFS